MAQIRALVVEQPANFRFRYKSERRHRPGTNDEERAGAGIPGASSTPDRKTYPSIAIEGYEGWATIRVSCVGSIAYNGNYRAHPHELVGSSCSNGYCERWEPVADSARVISFDKVALLCTKKADIKEALELRKTNKVDPFRTGFSHADDPNNINLGAVRLCFEVFIHKQEGGLMALPPLVSDVFYDLKKLSKLQIRYVSHFSAPVQGGISIVLLCNKIFQEHINVKFFEIGADERRVWESSVQAEFIFQHVAVMVIVPPYRNVLSANDHKVFLELVDPTDGTRSTESYPFVYAGVYPDVKGEPQEELRVKCSNKYDYLVTRKRTKLPCEIPPEVDSRASTSAFQDFPYLTDARASTSAAYVDTINQSPGSPAGIERFYSVPAPKKDKQYLHRKNSCPNTSDAQLKLARKPSSTSSWQDRPSNQNVMTVDTNIVPGLSSDSWFHSVPSGSGTVGHRIPVTHFNPGSVETVHFDETLQFHDSIPEIDLTDISKNGSNPTQPELPDLGPYLEIPPIVNLPDFHETFPPQVNQVQADADMAYEDIPADILNSPNFPATLDDFIRK